MHSSNAISFTLIHQANTSSSSPSSLPSSTTTTNSTFSRSYQASKGGQKMPCISGSYHTKPRIKNATQLVLYLSIKQAQHHYYRHHLDHHNLLQQKDDKRMVCIRWNIPWALARLYPKCRLATLSVGGRRIRLCTISIKEDHQRWISTAT